MPPARRHEPMPGIARCGAGSCSRHVALGRGETNVYAAASDFGADRTMV